MAFRTFIVPLHGMALAIQVQCMDGEEFRAWLLHVSSANIRHDSDFDAQLVVAHCFKKLQRELWDSEVRGNEFRPLMQTYMADGWGCTVRSTSTFTLGSHSVRRKGKHRHEFLLQRRLL